MYNILKRFYDKGLYTKANVHAFVSAKRITEEEYLSIVGEE